MTAVKTEDDDRSEAAATWAENRVAIWENKEESDF